MIAAAAEPPSLVPLPRSFYEGRVLDIARAMIGCVIVHRTDEGVAAGRIVECEAYRGPEDLAAHRAGGRRTPRRAYMFLLYGMHWAFNVVVAPEGQPHAVLVRAIEPTLGLDLMASRRGVAAASVALTNGPGKLTAALGLDGRAYGADLAGDRLFLAAGARRAAIGRSPRINIDYAGAWVKKPWRFFERGNRYVSVPPRE